MPEGTQGKIVYDYDSVYDYVHVSFGV